MSDAIDRITSHWRTRARMRKIEVPEWGITIHYRPPNIAQRINLEKALKERGDHAAAVEAVLLLALDEQGRRIFSDGHRAELMHEADPDVIVRVAGELMQGPDPEAVEKN